MMRTTRGMSSMIREGDNVWVYYVDHRGNEKSRAAVVLNMPRGAGDLLQVQWTETHIVEALNVYNPRFISLSRETKKP